MAETLSQVISRFLLLGGVIVYVLRGNVIGLLAGCILALGLELTLAIRRRQRFATGGVVVIHAILDFVMLLGLVALFFQSRVFFFCVLVTWVSACWLLPFIAQRSCSKKP
jgi:uncharacterized membrane protein (UPF0136 family)